MAFAPVAWSSSLNALSGLIKPLRRGALRRSGAALPAQAAYAAAQLHAPNLAAIVASVAGAVQAAQVQQPHGVPSARPATPPRSAARPLRVILRQQDDGACRLVISGRMADVCAELDRLALH
ncbi:hypothetical protein SAMN05428957_105203 [Oryzisolibacter propanilivorax]|uniref:Uncharacterized protein n=1 Tax=Oryzisolibacter propanilivorax TaxID=1527607 RepID=A0A1G9SXE9_9BURK|nr:hypothetical protein [Oryzisolibacter propanilivorax]SDM40100.1 hypothetical protein SAMN05428957_105203 [Oryzisolibacter propanilivorax]